MHRLFILQKTKYLARWKGRDGRWHYRYTRMAGPKSRYGIVPAGVFVKTRDSMMPSKYSAFVTSYTPEEYKEKGAELFISPNGQSGYAIDPEGDLISVFSKPGSGAGVELMKTAIKNGARKLDCIGPYLPQFYARFGFTEYDHLVWDDQSAPADWNYDKFDRPDINMMKLEKPIMKSEDKKNKGAKQTEEFKKLSIEFARDFFGDKFVDETLKGNEKGEG